MAYDHCGMIPSDRRPFSAPSPSGAEEQSERSTLPPPEWSTALADAKAATLAPPALARRSGVRAEEAWRRARVEEARAGNDEAALRKACAALARWLASRDRDLDEAVELASTALSVEEDIELRREMAAWLESLGEPAQAATALRPIASMSGADPTEAAYVHLKAGVLKARAGVGAAAAAAFEAALEIDPSDPVPAELLGTLSAWAPEVLSAAAAAEAYVEAARRRAMQGHADGELENLWRAIATDPSSEMAARALWTRSFVASERRQQTRLRGRAPASLSPTIHRRLPASRCGGGPKRARRVTLDARLQPHSTKGSIVSWRATGAHGWLTRCCLGRLGHARGRWQRASSAASR